MSGSNDTEPKVLLTVDEASALINIGRTRLYQLIREGAIESVTIGTSRRIPRASIDAFVARLREFSPGTPVG